VGDALALGASSSAISMLRASSSNQRSPISRVAWLSFGSFVCGITAHGVVGSWDVSVGGVRAHARARACVHAFD